MSLPAAYFDAMYEQSADPWGFTTRWYEQRKYALTLASLPRRRYRSAFEAGCSIGVFSAALAGRCDALLCADRSAAAVAIARRRLVDHPQVTVVEWALPRWPTASFDLVVLSEVAYYFDGAELADLIGAAVGSLEPGGHLVAAHWRHPVAEHPQSGDEVHRAIAAAPDLGRVSRHDEDDFLLEVFARIPPDAQSVARAEGLC